MVCAPCMLPLLTGMGAIGTGGVATFQQKRRNQILMILIALILLLIFMLVYHNRNSCKSCQLAD
jgi:uncharacterized integral membrane protein